MIFEYLSEQCARPVVVWGALALTGYTRISLPQIHFRAKSSESILVVLECLNGHLVASCGSNYRFRRLGAPMPCGAGSSIIHLLSVDVVSSFDIFPHLFYYFCFLC